MQLVNAPQKVTAPVKALAAAVGRWCGLPGVVSVFLTEVAAQDRGSTVTAAAPPGWTAHRRQGHGAGLGFGECAILTKDSHYNRILARRWFKVWDGGGKGRLAHAIYAIAVVAETVNGHVDVLTGCHTPAHVEGLWAHLPLPERVRARVLLRKNRSRVQTYLKVMHSWRLQTMALAAEFHADDVVAAPDGNLDAHKQWVRQLLHRAWPGMHLAVTKAPDLGRRAVGWVLTTMTPGASRVEKSGAESDHDAGVYTFTRANQVPAQHQKATKPPAPFERCTYNGALMDQFTKTAIQTLERGPLKDMAPLTILQGCWNPGGVSASAGTHDRSGVIDLAPYEYGRKVKAWRDLLGPMWHRPAISGLWSEHCHGVISSCTELAPIAAGQVGEYYAGQDGLADHARDPNQHHPKVTFDYAAAWKALQAG